jgi:hypothetical protein
MAKANQFPFSAISQGLKRTENSFNVQTSFISRSNDEKSSYTNSKPSLWLATMKRNV